MSQCGRYSSVENKLKRFNDLDLCDQCTKPGHPTEHCQGAKEAFKDCKDCNKKTHYWALCPQRYYIYKYLYELCSKRTWPTLSSIWSGSIQNKNVDLIVC